MARLLWPMLLMFCAFGCVSTTQDTSLKISAPPNGEWWMQHLKEDLIPFWEQPSALGEPQGAFPSVRCDNGKLLDPKAPCPEIARVEWMLKDRSRYLVSLSRQIYGYGVAFHMTGDRKYLSYMKSGVDFVRKHAIDRANGGTFAVQDLETGKWGPKPEDRNPQELGYGLLGLTFYYYLTGDKDVLADIIAAKESIFKNYYDASTATMRWQFKDQPLSRRLTAHLDQMNTYMALITPLLPEPHQSQWKKELKALSKTMITTFYVPSVNLFFLQADRADDTNPDKKEADFGHSSKTFWMLRLVGLMNNDKELLQFVDANAPRLLETAFNAKVGTWIESRKPGGVWNHRKSWWVHAELDQLTGSLALADPKEARYLAQTTEYWQKYFVDHKYGEVYYGLTENDKPALEFPKQWAWKNAYHTLEHALIGYITARSLENAPIELYYAFSEAPKPASLRAYFFEAETRQVVNTSQGADAPVWKVSYAPIRQRRT